MKKNGALIFLCLWITGGNAQVTFSENIAPIIYNKCSNCHHKGDIGPMPLTNYKEVSDFAKMIEQVTENKQMPPWMPETGYSHFLDERTLSAAEIADIKKWIADGKPEGNKAAAPELPLFSGSSKLGTPDLTVGMTQSFLHKGTNTDEYRVFVLPTRLTEGHNVSAIEIVPGNPKIAHHIILGLDTTGRANKLDAKDAGYGYEQYAGFGFYPTYDNWSGWIPGNKTRFFPDKIGNYILPNSNILLQMHYGPTPLDQKDSTVVNVFYSKAPLNRYVRTQLIGPNEIKDGPFFIQANKTKTFHAQYKVMADYSLISITPHSHWLGKSWEVYAVNPKGDTTRLIKIDNWDFNWQNFFSFQKYIKIEKGSIIYANASFDNTAANPRNPNNPVKNVTWGESARDEMFLCYFAYVPYEKGDEAIEIGGNPDALSVNYAPAEKKLTINFSVSDRTGLYIKLCDDKGNVTKFIQDKKEYAAGSHQLAMDAKSIKPGMYWCKLTSAYYCESKKIVID